jgi:hypothetical protein
MMIASEQNTIARIYYSFMLLVMVIEYLSGHLIHQLCEPVLIHPAADNTYWLLHLLFIPQWIAQSSFVEIVFEGCWVAIAISCLFFRSRVWLNVLFTLFFLVFIVTKNSYVAHQEHGINAAFLMSFIFWTNSEIRFSFLFRAFRYYVLFIFVSAACWKIFRESFFNPIQLSETLKNQHAYFLSMNPQGAWYSVITYLINHSWVSHTIFVSAVLLQLSFAAGFFTRKFDKWLLVLFFLFFAGDWLLMGLSFYQTFIAAIVFLNWKSLQPLAATRE